MNLVADDDDDKFVLNLYIFVLISKRWCVIGTSDKFVAFNFIHELAYTEHHYVISHYMKYSSSVRLYIYKINYQTNQQSPTDEGKRKEKREGSCLASI